MSILVITLFRVKAANSDGIWNEEGIAVQVTISPPFWRTWWFYLLASLSASLVAYSYHQYRLRQVSNIERARADAEESIRARLWRNLHDELGVLVTIISLSSNILRRKLRKSSPEINDHLRKITENVDKLSVEMKASIWEIDPKQDSVYDLAVQLKNFSDHLIDETDMAFQLVGLSDDLAKITLPIEWRQHLSRIFKEGMHNILKHARGCKNIALKIGSNYDLTIILSDDGRGFDLENCTLGNGIKNMQHRARKIGGKLEIISGIGDGVRIQFRGKRP